MNPNDILPYLATLRKYRVTLYLSSEKIEHWYLQKDAQITEVGAGEALAGKVEAGFLGFLKSEVGADRSREAKVAVDNVIVQAVVAENAARAAGTLVDLTAAPPAAGELLYYLGPARVTLMDTPLSPDTTGLDAKACAAISQARESQEKILRFFDPHAGTIVLTFPANHRALASIASLKSVTPNALSSYHGQKRYGILCTLENARAEAAFVDPL